MDNIFNFDFPIYKVSKKIRLIELFGGIGCQAQALKNIGANFEHYKLVEINKNAVTSYNAIHGTSFTASNIQKLDGGGLEIIDKDKYEYIMTYSFPCQDLSICGKRAGMFKDSNTRSGLLWEVERLLNETKELPQILLMENVTMVHSKENKEDFYDWCDFLESKGYSNYWKDLIASDFGIPQMRKRTYMISILGDYRYIFPKPTLIKTTISLLLEKRVDKKYYLSLHEIKRIKSWNSFQKPLEHITFLCDVCPTIIAKDNGVIQAESGSAIILYDGKGLRYLTSIEKARLMGFKDEIVKKILSAGVSERQLQKQLGNGIVVPVLEEIFKMII